MIKGFIAVIVLTMFSQGTFSQNIQRIEKKPVRVLTVTSPAETQEEPQAVRVKATPRVPVVKAKPKPKASTPPTKKLGVGAKTPTADKKPAAPVVATGCKWEQSPYIYFSSSCSKQRFCMGYVKCGAAATERVICSFKSGAYTCPESADACRAQSKSKAVKFVTTAGK